MYPGQVMAFLDPGLAKVVSKKCGQIPVRGQCLRCCDAPKKAGNNSMRSFGFGACYVNFEGEVRSYLHRSYHAVLRP